jgi:CspA family cold shock protein
VSTSPEHALGDAGIAGSRLPAAVAGQQNLDPGGKPCQERAATGFRPDLLLTRCRFLGCAYKISQNSDCCRSCDARRSVDRSVQRQEGLMPVGTVKFFNMQKGFGFIQPTDGSKDVFVHISAVQRAGMQTLVEGQKVSFDVVTERGKTAASNLQAA